MPIRQTVRRCKGAAKETESGVGDAPADGDAGVEAVREFLIEVPHGREECSAAHAGLADAPGGVYWGCEAGTHTTWIIAELAAEHEAWRLVPRLLRDTARVVPVVEPGRLLTTGGEKR
jgi:hypothetical protein